MKFKCIAYSTGVDVSINSSVFFTYRKQTHLITELSDGNVRVSRRIDNLVELLSEPLSNFVYLDGTQISTTFEGLATFFNTDRLVSAGEGISAVDGVVSVLAGGPSTLGGFKVGTGLTVDGQGRLSASSASEVTKVLATEAEMLAQATEMLRPYRIIRLDTKRLYYLNAGDSPAVLENWFEGPSIETTVLSFKGRTGVVDPAFADYNFELIPLTDKTTSADNKLVIDDNKLFIENIETSARKQIAYSDDVDLTAIQASVNYLDDVVNGPAFGLVKKVSDIETSINRLDSQTSQATTRNTEQDARLGVIDSKLLDKADLVSGKVPLSQLPDITAGRKVNVANRAARLALKSYADLTIAYQSDTAEAWALNANENPAIDSNWSKLGDANVQGVTAFNGRTGQVAPQTNDYHAGQISELVDKQFVTADQKTDWSSRETTTGSQSKATAAIASAKLYADNTFIPLTQKGATNGLAPLVSGRVPVANLPVNQTNGVAGLDANGKINPTQYNKGAASGVAPLDSDSRVPINNLPTFLPQSKRIWRDVKSVRNVGTWYNNTSPNEREVHVRASLAGAPANRFVSLQIRENASATSFIFNSTVLTNVGTGGLTYADANTITVPAGWQYQLASVGGSTNELTERWYELY
jgi:hypothetical protein